VDWVPRLILSFCLGNCLRKLEGSSLIAIDADRGEGITLATILSPPDAWFLSIAATNMTDLLSSSNPAR